MTNPFLPESSEAVWVAIITALVAPVLILLVKSWTDARLKAAESRLEAQQRRIDAHDTFITDVVTWAFELEEHIYLGKPPPPPDRPRSLIQFFAMRLTRTSATTDSPAGHSPIPPPPTIKE